MVSALPLICYILIYIAEGETQNGALCYRNRLYGTWYDASGDACRMDTGASRIHQLLYLGLYLYPTRYRRLINDPQPTGRFFRKETINLLINLTH